MSETPSTLFNKRRKDAALARANGSVFSCGLLIAGAFVLLATVFALQTPTIETQSVSVIEPPPPRRVRQTPPPVFETETFYRTIIENNLFRPLGWRPPRPTEPYRLIGTLLPRSANTPPQAIIETTAGNKTYIVTTGEKIDASTEVVSIAGKQVILSTDGQQRTLHLPSGF